MHRVHEPKQQAITVLYPETTIYSHLEGMDFDRIIALTTDMRTLQDYEYIEYYDCDGFCRTCPGHRDLLAIIGDHGDIYDAVQYLGQTDGTLPPLISMCSIGCARLSDCTIGSKGKVPSARLAPHAKCLLDRVGTTIHHKSTEVLLLQMLTTALTLHSTED